MLLGCVLLRLLFAFDLPQLRQLSLQLFVFPFEFFILLHNFFIFFRTWWNNRYRREVRGLTGADKSGAVPSGGGSWRQKRGVTPICAVALERWIWKKRLLLPPAPRRKNCLYLFLSTGVQGWRCGIAQYPDDVVVGGSHAKLARQGRGNNRGFVSTARWLHAARPRR